MNTIWMYTEDYLKKSKHIDNATLIYATPEFWSGVTKMTDNPAG